jgi:hypothetical protein
LASMGSLELREIDEAKRTVAAMAMSVDRSISQTLASAA